MKRHQITSLTCRALDIANAAPGDTAENENVTKDDLVNPHKSNNQTDKGNDSADAESDSEIIESSSEDVVSESEEERPIKKHRIFRKRRKILRKPQHNFKTHTLPNSNIARALWGGPVRNEARLGPPPLNPNIKTHSFLNSNIARALWGGAVRNQARLGPPPHNPYTYAMTHSRNVLRV
jgi:hypothetical protein